MPYERQFAGRVAPEVRRAFVQNLSGIAPTYYQIAPSLTPNYPVFVFSFFDEDNPDFFDINTWHGVVVLKALSPSLRESSAALVSGIDQLLTVSGTDNYPWNILPRTHLTLPVEKLGTDNMYQEAILLDIELYNI